MVGLNLWDLGATAENLKKSWTGSTEYLHNFFYLFTGKLGADPDNKTSSLFHLACPLSRYLKEKHQPSGVELLIK